MKQARQIHALTSEHMEEFKMELTIKKLSTCSFEEAASIWNSGFEGYFVDIAMTADRFTSRIGLEGLSPALSIVGYFGDEPAGILMNGMKKIGNQKIAWNGGTGVASKFRRQGVGRALMEAAIELYKREEVDIAMLEAFSKNEKAIALYEQLGFEVVDQLLFLEHKDGFASEPFYDTGNYTVTQCFTQEAAALPFYQTLMPWQTQSANIKDGQALILKTAHGEAIGYALFKKIYENGDLRGIVLYQCHIKDDVADSEAAIQTLLHHVYGPSQQVCNRSTYNLTAKSKEVVAFLKDCGFTTRAEQVFMVKKM